MNVNVIYFSGSSTSYNILRFESILLCINNRHSLTWSLFFGLQNFKTFSRTTTHKINGKTGSILCIFGVQSIETHRFDSSLASQVHFEEVKHIKMFYDYFYALTLTVLLTVIAKKWNWKCNETIISINATQHNTINWVQNKIAASARQQQQRN